jgi:hypothetical protein
MLAKWHRRVSFANQVRADCRGTNRRSGFASGSASPSGADDVVVLGGAREPKAAVARKARNLTSKSHQIIGRISPAGSRQRGRDDLSVPA